MNGKISNRGWLGKVSAGLIFGFLLGLGASGFFNLVVVAGQVLFGPENLVSTLVLNLVWVLVVSLCFLFGSVRRAWCCLGLATAGMWALLHVSGGLA